METDSERSHRLEASRRYSAEKRARESEEKKAERRMMDRKRAAERRARESQWEREHRLALGRQRAAERRAAENEEEREHRLARNRERLASKRASKPELEKLTLEAAAMLPGPTPGPWQEGGDLDRYEQQQQQPVPMSFNGALFQDLERAGLTTAKSTSDPLLPVGTSSASDERKSTSDPLLPVGTTSDEREVDMMASAGVVQPQQEQQAGATATEQATAPSTSGGASGGGEKSSELKQEVLEIKEFRAGKSCGVKVLIKAQLCVSDRSGAESGEALQ